MTTASEQFITRERQDIANRLKFLAAYLDARGPTSEAQELRRWAAKLESGEAIRHPGDDYAAAHQAAGGDR